MPSAAGGIQKEPLLHTPGFQRSCPPVPQPKVTKVYHFQLLCLCFVSCCRKPTLLSSRTSWAHMCKVQKKGCVVTNIKPSGPWSKDLRGIGLGPKPNSAHGSQVTGIRDFQESYAGLTHTLTCTSRPAASPLPSWNNTPSLGHRKSPPSPPLPSGQSSSTCGSAEHQCINPLPLPCAVPAVLV